MIAAVRFTGRRRGGSSGGSYPFHPNICELLHSLTNHLRALLQLRELCASFFLSPLQADLSSFCLSFMCFITYPYALTTLPNLTPPAFSICILISTFPRQSSQPLGFHHKICTHYRLLRLLKSPPLSIDFPLPFASDGPKEAVIELVAPLARVFYDCSPLTNPLHEKTPSLFLRHISQ